MFNVGPMELLVLALVGVIVLGPERLPGLARQAAELLRTLRDLATGARQQLRDELGPEFADVDLRNLNPRTAVTRAVFGDEFDPSRLNPRTAVRDAIFGDEDERIDLRKEFDVRADLRGDLADADPRRAVREARDSMYDDDAVHVNGVNGRANGHGSNGHGSNGHGDGVRFAKPAAERPRPRPRPASRPPATPYDDDAT